ncbi:MAG: hypothetical protein WCJ30_01935 [Deltaproteobacteria bacterium]
MRAWQRHRSAPLGVLTAGATAVLVTLAVAAVFYVSVVRRSRGRAAYTTGLPRATLAAPLSRRAAYQVQLDGPAGRTTPAGTPSAAHRWRVTAPAAPDDPLCEGAAADDIAAVDDTGRRAVLLALPRRMFVQGSARALPPRVRATCPAALASAQRADALEYTEEFVPRGLPAEIVACVDLALPDAPLGPCDDGAPSRIFAREPPEIARARARGAMLRVAAFGWAFTVLCFAAGVMALRQFDRARRTS